MVRALRRAARVAEAAGLDSLRLNLRGADRMGEDGYHAGLTADLAAALASPELADYRSVGVLGFSLGGHPAFSPRLDLGLGGVPGVPLGVEAQLVSWLGGAGSEGSIG